MPAPILSQDASLTLVLEETTPEIWKKKLDWLAEKGGMVLINVHPDYVGFDGNNKKANEYPAAFYAEFLKHVKEKFGDDYWHALPHEVAAWYRENCVAADKKTAPAAPAANGVPKKIFQGQSATATQQA